MKQPMKFIVLTSLDGDIVVINVEKITYMIGDATGTVIHVEDGDSTSKVRVQESPDQIYIEIYSDKQMFVNQ